MRTVRKGPEGLVRDRRRGSWIMIVPAGQFIAGHHVRERRAEREASRESQRGAARAADEPEARIFPTEIALVFGLAAVLMYMFWSLAHI